MLLLFEVLVVSELGEELLRSSVGADFRQSQHDVHFLTTTIVHVKYVAEMGNTNLQQVLPEKAGGTLNNVQVLISVNSGLRAL